MKAALAFTSLLLSTVILSAAPVQEQDGQIRGVVVDSSGRPAAGQQVELRRPKREGLGRVVVITNADGEFTYTRLGPGSYQVEWLIKGRVVAQSAPVELSELMMQVSNVTVALPEAKAFIDGLGIGEKARVKVELRDGTKVSGYVRRANEESFTVTDSDGFGFRSTTIAYGDVLKVSKGRSELTKFLIFTGVMIGSGMAALLIAVAAAGGP